MRGACLALLLCHLSCQRATPPDETVNPPAVAELPSAMATVAKTIPNAETKGDPNEETRWIAIRWARELPTYQYEKDMCGAYEKSPERLHPPSDVWGTPFRVQCDRSRNLYVFVSAGADQQFQTADDVSIRRRSDPVSTYTGKR